MHHFAAKHGSFICRRLLDGCELTTEEPKTIRGKRPVEQSLQAVRAKRIGNPRRNRVNNQNADLFTNLLDIESSIWDNSVCIFGSTSNVPPQ
jgi:hypothetical protein